MDQQLADISEKLENLTDFLRKHMVTKQELEDLKSDLPTKADFHLLQSSVDGLAKQFKNTDDELKVVVERASRIEAWIKKAAPKVGVEYKP